MTKIYISGKISGIKIELAKQNFYFSCKEIVKYHNADIVVNPFDIKPFLGSKCWLCYMIADIAELRKCTHIAMQKNWTDSRGAVIEYYFAKFIFKQKIIFL